MNRRVFLAGGLALAGFVRRAWAQLADSSAGSLCPSHTSRHHSCFRGQYSMAAGAVCGRGSGGVAPSAHQRRPVSNSNPIERAVRDVSSRAVPGRSRDRPGTIGSHDPSTTLGAGPSTELGAGRRDDASAVRVRMPRERVRRRGRGRATVGRNAARALSVSDRRRSRRHSGNTGDRRGGALRSLIQNHEGRPGFISRY